MTCEQHENDLQPNSIEKEEESVPANGTGILPTTSDPADYLRRELYDRMQKEQDLFTWLQRAALDGIWYWDLKNPEMEWMSPELKELFGYTDEEVPNTSAWWQDNIFPEDKEGALKAYQDHVKHGTPYDMVVRYRHKDGSTVWVRCRGKADLDENGIPYRMLGAHSDVTSLMKDLKQKEIDFDLLCTTSLDGFWDWNLETGAQTVSARWQTSLGYKEGEIKSTREAFEALLHPEDAPKAKEAVRQHMDDGAQYSAVLRYKRKNGTWAHMLVQGVAQKDERGEWVRMFGTHTDVSDLERARAKARSADAAKTTFLATMSHEIRTPLNAVLGMAQVLMTTDLTPEQQDCVSALHHSGSHLLSLLNDILDFSQIEAGHLAINNEVFDIQRTARDILDVMKEEAKKKNIALSFETRVPVGTKFTGDSERVRQIIFNLLGNAVKFTKRGVIGIRLLPESREDDSGLMIEIHDTGIGMNQEQKDLVFREFTQADNQVRRKYGGSGLGLSICRKLVRRVGGSLDVASEPGMGSTFKIWLPGLALPPVGETTSPAVMNNVLVFDPRSSDLRTISNALEASGIAVTRCPGIEHLKNSWDATVHQAVVVVHDDGLGNEDQNICRTLNKHNGVRLVTVGTRLSSFMASNLHNDVREVGPFPTSDELLAALTTESVPKKLPSQSPPGIFQGGKKPHVLLVEDNLINQKVQTCCK